MPESVRRGFVPSDEMDFCGEQLTLLQKAQNDIFFLLNRGYGIQQSVAFVSNRFQFSARQRMALTRATCSRDRILNRKGKELSDGFADGTVAVDGFNLIITLEAALSGSTVLLCMDGTLRDLCGLRGTYRIIDKTGTAIALAAAALEKIQVNRAVFVLDAQVSNSGRLKQRIIEVFSGYHFLTEVELEEKADASLLKNKCVASSDSVILDRCSCWVNLAKFILDANLPNFEPIDLSGRYNKCRRTV